MSDSQPTDPTEFVKILPPIKIENQRAKNTEMHFCHSGRSFNQYHCE